MLDTLPAWARHLIITLVGAFAGSMLGDIISASGVTALDWTQALTDAVNASALAGATASAALWSLPLTRQYGVGSGPGDYPA